MRLKILALLAATLANGCTVGPEYRRPETASAGGWIAPVAPDAVDDQWWKAMGDPVLDALVADAIAHNLDLVQAEARLREARANLVAAGARTVPQVNATGSVVEQQLSTNGQLPINNIPGFRRRYGLFDGGFDASWEIDLWGGVSRSVQSARARAVAALERAADTRLRIIAETVRTYVELRNAQSRARLLARENDLRHDIANLVALRYLGGESSAGDAAQARQRASAAAAQLSEADAAAHAAAYSLATLTGRPPEAMTALVRSEVETGPKDHATLPEPPPIIAGAIRSELLRRRPDVRAAEADLMAATADIGVETANLYPRFSLTGSIGQQSRGLGNILDPASTRFSVGPSFSWPVFTLGRIRAQIRAANARADAGAAAYEKAVLVALADSETAANRYAAAITARGDRGRASENARVAADLATLRFKHGEDDRIQMLEVQSTAIQADQAMLAARAEAALAYVAFAKSLGGGAATMPQP